MKTSHTPAPWTVNGNSVLARKYGWQGAIIAECNFKDLKSRTFDTLKSEANARRIVAAINACEGLSTEDLENNIIARMLNELHAKESWMIDYCDSTVTSYEAELRELRQVIEEAKGLRGSDPELAALLGYPIDDKELSEPC